MDIESTYSNFLISSQRNLEKMLEKPTSDGHTEKFDSSSQVSSELRKAKVHVEGLHKGMKGLLLKFNSTVKSVNSFPSLIDKPFNRCDTLKTLARFYARSGMVTVAQKVEDRRALEMEKEKGETHEAQKSKTKDIISKDIKYGKSTLLVPKKSNSNQVILNNLSTITTLKKCCDKFDIDWIRKWINSLSVPHPSQPIFCHVEKKLLVSVKLAILRAIVVKKIKFGGKTDSISEIYDSMDLGKWKGNEKERAINICKNLLLAASLIRPVRYPFRPSPGIPSQNKLKDELSCRSAQKSLSKACTILASWRVGESEISPLPACIQAGIKIIGPLCEMKERIPKWQEESFITLPYSPKHYINPYHGVFLCPVTHEMTNDSIETTPMRLECGHVISGKAVAQLRSGAGSVKCVYCSKHSHIDNIEKVQII
ncbi:putative multi-domain containing protein [Aduncisulcus paluster]|uniref:Multi-domain containing protein n=1 Tax=Aduncisulcus paluster TaxID=2918883 RepID=A0ABQ5KRJ9_9EUKA|nr:putative multi-domain containing protein [Aduncisulcus paluster]